jgi:hypothetical protein
MAYVCHNIVMDNRKDKLLEYAEKIRMVIANKQKELELSFVEDTHTYYIKDKNGTLVSNFPSVSTVICQFYEPFDDLTKSYEMCNGDLMAQDTLLTEWRATADYANSTGSRVHFLLETDLLKLYKSPKEVRRPIFECNEEQITIGNAMIDAGHKFIQLMHRRGAVLLDTEMVLGSAILGYTGQPDKVWLMFDKDGNLGFVITDWKTNKPKNFEIQAYTGYLLPPFEEFTDTALEHYKIQLPLYGRLILDMLKGSEFENIKFLGCVIVHLLKEGKYNEYRVENVWINTIMNMNPLQRIDSVYKYKKTQKLREENRVNEVKKLLNG